MMWKIQEDLVSEKEPAKKKSLLQEFVTFLQTFGVIGLAIAFVVGQASSKLVTSIVQSLVNPFIGLMLPDVDALNQLSFSIENSTFSYGQVIADFIDFAIIAFIVFLAYKQLTRFKLVEDKTKS